MESTHITSVPALSSINSLSQGFNLMSNIYYIIIIILVITVSAFIYVSVSSWFQLLQLYYYSFMNNNITAQFYYALTAILITLTIIGIFFYLYWKFSMTFKNI